MICVPLGLSIYSTLCVFYPQIRGNWRGSTQPIGTMSAVGMALFFDGAALILFVGPFLPVWLVRWTVPYLLGISMIGFVLAVLGSFRDTSPKK
jgi:hypothetical protein